MPIFLDVKMKPSLKRVPDEIRENDLRHDV